MEKDWKAHITGLDQSLRQGRHGSVRQELSRTNAREVPRPWLESLANVARRAGAFSLALRLLNPVCRPVQGIRRDASAGELAEYGMALVKNGSFDEALGILGEIDPRLEPRTYLYQAFARFPRWEYGEALPLLDQFLERVDAAAYEHRIAQVNRLAALIFVGSLDAASASAEELLERTVRDGQRLLQANVLELSAQVAIQSEDFARAREWLEKARALLSDSPVGDRLFVDKWQAVIRLTETAGLDRAPLEEVRRSALRLGHWETLRDCDFHEARHRARPDLFARLFHGTPHEAYRRRLLDVLSSYGAPRDLYSRGSGAMSERTLEMGEQTLDIEAATWKGGNALFRPGGVEHRLLLQLNRDYYRPERIGSLFAAVYPGEYFNPVTSPLRVHQAMRRLRRSLRAAEIPLRIREEAHQYFLVPASGCAIGSRLSREEPRHRELELRFRPIAVFLGEAPVAARELSRLSGLSISTVTRLLNDAREAGWVVAEGRGPARRYRLVQGRVSGALPPSSRAA